MLSHLLLVGIFALGSSMAQTYNNGQWSQTSTTSEWVASTTTSIWATPTTTTSIWETTTTPCDTCDYYTSSTGTWEQSAIVVTEYSSSWVPSYTTWTSCQTYGTVTVTVTLTSQICDVCESEHSTTATWDQQATTTVQQQQTGAVQPISTETYVPTPGSTVVVVIMPSNGQTTVAQGEQGSTTLLNGQTGVVQVISNTGVRVGADVWLGLLGRVVVGSVVAVVGVGMGLVGM